MNSGDTLQSVIGTDDISSVGNSITNTINSVNSNLGNKANNNHSHNLAIATSSGTNAITLAASTKYQLTTGGSTYIFTTPPNTNTTYSAVPVFHYLALPSVTVVFWL